MNTSRDLFHYDPARHWRIRALSHHMTWFLGTRFPTAFPFIFVVGYPKSGTTWVCQIVADYLQLPFPQYSILPIGCPAVVHGHERASRRFKHSVYVLRDGRDALVSKYFHLLRWAGIPEGDHPQLTRLQRKFFPKMANRDHVRENLPAFLDKQLRAPQFSKINWAAHVNSYYDSKHDGMIELRYEGLRQTPQHTFEKAMSALSGATVDEQRVGITLSRFSFDQQTGRSVGDEDRKSFLRKGTVGDWRNHFTREAAQIFDHHCGETLVRAGYEVDHAWVDACETT